MSVATIRPAQPGRGGAGAVGWVFTAFALLAAGVFVGAIAQPRQWAWAFPVAGFLLYVFAFRRGLSRIGDFDVLWREGARHDPQAVPDPPARLQQKTAGARVARVDFARPAGADRHRSATGPEVGR